MDEIHDRVADAAVVAVVTTDYLRRSAVVSKASADDTSGHAVDEAPLDRFRQRAPSYTTQPRRSRSVWSTARSSWFRSTPSLGGQHERLCSWPVAWGGTRGRARMFQVTASTVSASTVSPHPGWCACPWWSPASVGRSRPGPSQAHRHPGRRLALTSVDDDPTP
ncbi:DUF6192 family protein [Streptomyces sp. AC550_RSS872]|uniref:DUF6192 family protein n=1 Tax=Streptomyces sp. AC550_RSS872 TaxID=2823689 RepID=UPI0027E3EE43|nr:DUF6192 family protein [Streptomyces sp. AC550_RSS872]